MTAQSVCRPGAAMKMSPTFPAALLLCLCSGCGKAPGAAPAGRPLRFVVSTFNMNWGNVDLADTVDVIRRAGADLVCLQETNPAAEAAIRRALSRDYPHMSFTKDVHMSNGFAFLSKAPLANVKHLAPKFGFFGTLLADVELPLGRGVPPGPGADRRTVRVASVHLEPVYPREGNEGTMELFNIFLGTESLHLDEIKRIHGEFAEGRPAIIAGDFNSASFGSAPRFLKERGLVDSFAAVTPNPDAHVTWNWSYGGVEWRFRIDYVFHTGEMRTVESRVIDAASSDHKAVVSVIEWREPDEGAPRGEL